MENLEKIFETRDSLFRKQTFRIFEIISTTLVCVDTFLCDIDPIFAAGDITWEEVNLIDDGVIIIGMVNYTIGTEMEIDNNNITITEENIEYFRRIVHMSLPIDLVYKNDEDIIMHFLYEMQNNNNISTFSEPLELKSDVNFDLSQLTPKQREALMLHNNKEKN